MSFSKGFRFPANSTQAPKTKPDMPKAELDNKVPKNVNQSIDNPNKSFLKKASLVQRAKAIASKDLDKSASIVKSLKGAAKAIKDKTTDTAKGVGHYAKDAGGGNVRDAIRANAKGNVERAVKQDSKLSSKALSNKYKGKIDEAVQRRTAARATAGAATAAGGAAYVSHKGNKKKQERAYVQGAKDYHAAVTNAKRSMQ